MIDSGVLHRVLAQTEIAFSNSLKHQWLYLNELDTASSLRRLVDFYVREHNTRLPHSAFQGQTPDEMYLGTGEHVPQDLDSRRRAACAARLATNRSVSCATCEGQGAA